MPAVLRVGDVGSHGGPISTGSTTSKADGIAIARNGDNYECAIHGLQTLECTGQSTADGKIIATVGKTTATCGATFSSGSTNVTAN